MYKIMSEESQSEDRVILQLGDIIEIEAEDDDTINKKILFIKYIDSNKLHLVNETTDLTLQINDGILDNVNISAINILNRQDEPGYAMQNGLVTNQWINIYLEGEIPIVIIGQITDLNNDQIEIKTIVSIQWKSYRIRKKETQRLKKTCSEMNRKLFLGKIGKANL